MNDNRQLAGILVAVAIVSSGCTGLGLPSGPLADDHHSHEDGGSIHVDVAGDIDPGNTVTVTVTHDDEPIANAEVYLEYEDGTSELVGQTDENGQLTVTVPESGSLSVVARSEGLEGRYPAEHHEEENGHEA